MKKDGDILINGSALHCTWWEHGDDGHKGGRALQQLRDGCQIAPLLSIKSRSGWDMRDSKLKPDGETSHDLGNVALGVPWESSKTSPKLCRSARHESPGDTTGRRQAGWLTDSWVCAYLCMCVCGPWWGIIFPCLESHKDSQHCVKRDQKVDPPINAVSIW